MKVPRRKTAAQRRTTAAARATMKPPAPELREEIERLANRWSKLMPRLTQSAGGHNGNGTSGTNGTHAPKAERARRTARR